MAEPAPHTVVSLFLDRVAADAERRALLVPEPDGFVPRNWDSLAADACRAAEVLAELGVVPGDRVIQVSENRYEWLVVDLAVHLVRGVHVAVHASLTGPQILYQIVDSGARLAIVSTADQAGKLSAVAGRLPAGLRLAAHDAGVPAVGEVPVLHLGALAAAADASQGAKLAAAARRHTRPGDLATILYTSGTTGEPKGVMLSHENLASNALATQQALPLLRDDLRLGWLPLSHIFARTSDYYMWLAVGCTLALARGRETVIADCQQLAPTVLNAVPYFYDKLYRVLQEQGRADQPGALQQLLGGRMRCCCSGGAALPDHVARFFQRQGVPLVQGYGLTESSPVITIDLPDDIQVGTVGPPIPGIEVRIADDGEVLTRGPHVMLGYWNQPQATSAVLSEGWLHTGDLGRLDGGRLRITGRKKELLVTAGGKNIAPAFLEALLTEDPLIAQSMILGDGRNYLTALIVPDSAALAAAAAGFDPPLPPGEALLTNPHVLALMRSRVDARLSQVSDCEQVGQFTLLAQPFTIERDELTPTLKLRRGVVAEHYAAEIQRMYGG